MRRLHELFAGDGAEIRETEFLIPGYRYYGGRPVRVNILAMGDVGATLAFAMKLTGSDVVSRIGICDISETLLSRWEQELNQIVSPAGPDVLPPVLPLEQRQLFDCDVFVFCASRGVPDLSQTGVDVRMVQLEKNRELISDYASSAVEAGFDGEFFVVSDPVDPLCLAAAKSGISPQRIQGFGLGVMNGRAAYYARKAGCGDGLAAASADRTGSPAATADRTGAAAAAKYLTEGRVFGPHGEDLVVANSIADYDDEASRELTRLTTSANLKIRELGFKPYVAPAVSSGALSILENLRGNWHYSSAWFGGAGSGIGMGAGPGGEDASGGAQSGAFLGMRNRRCEDGLLVEDLPLDDRLFERIEQAYRALEELG